MTNSTESVKSYAEGLKADLQKATEKKIQAQSLLTETDNQIKLINGALQFATLLLQEDEKSSSEAKDIEEVEEAAQ